MCNYLVGKNIKCKISPNKPFCHIHINKKPKYLHEYEKVDKDIEIDTYKTKNDKLNDKIKKKNIQINQLEAIIKNLKEEIKQKNIIVNSSKESNEKVKNELLSEITALKNLNKSMYEDYNDYQIVKNYERLKNKLINDNVDLKKYHDNEFHELRFKRNFIVHEKTVVSP